MFFWVILLLVINVKDIDVRKFIIDNFKNDTTKEIREAIQMSIDSKDEDPLIGLGVLFELAWINGNDEFKDEVINNIKKGMQ